MQEVFIDALPSIISFIIIGILTFIGWGLRKLYKFTHQVQLLLVKETGNGGDSTKDLIRQISDYQGTVTKNQERMIESITSHHDWAINDAKRIAEKLGIEDD